MDLEKNKKNKIESMITVTMQFSLFFTKEEVDEGTDIPHEFIVAGCVECLASKNYNMQEDEVN